MDINKRKKIINFEILKKIAFNSALFNNLMNTRLLVFLKINLSFSEIHFIILLNYN